MNNSSRRIQRHQSQARRRRGFTLVEILVATSIALLLMAAVVRLFASVTASVTESRAVIEIAQSLQSAQVQLQNDLRYMTARGVPPFDPADQKGYLEIIDGPGPFVITGLGTMPMKADEIDPVSGMPKLDTTVGDMDDMLMMTVRSYGEPFYGRWFNADAMPPRLEIIQSQDAEIAWFTRGNKLYRRVRLITPGRKVEPAGLPNPATLGDYVGPGYGRRNDVAIRLDMTYGDKRIGLSSFNTFEASSLGDMTKRENRFGHDPFAYPYDARFWGAAGLPTQGDTSHIGDNPAAPVAPQAAPWTQPMPWGFAGDDPLGNAGPPVPATFFGYHGATDFWRDPYNNRDLTGAIVGSNIIDGFSGALLEYQSSGANNTNRNPTGNVYVNADSLSADGQTSRYSEDVVLGNVIGFDVKVWDRFAPVFIDPPAGGFNPRVVKPGDPGYQNLLETWVNNGQDPNAAEFARYGAYVDLFYTRQMTFASPMPFLSEFSGPGLGALSAANNTMAAVYDTGSNHYEQDGIDQFNDGVFDISMDGIDNDGNGVIDEYNERETTPPYPFALRSIQIKIRVFELDSRLVREVTVSHDLVD